MTFTNITENHVLNAAGRLVDPGKTILMEVKYYAEHKSFIDKYVAEKKAKIGGMDEYEFFLKNGEKEEEQEEQTDLLAEVQAEAEAEAVKPKEKAKTEGPKEEEPKADVQKDEEEPKEEKPKTTRRRRARDK